MTHLAKQIDARQERLTVFAVTGSAFPFRDRTVKIRAKKPLA
jgi:hypothetical protein